VITFNDNDGKLDCHIVLGHMTCGYAEVDDKEGRKGVVFINRPDAEGALGQEEFDKAPVRIFLWNHGPSSEAIFLSAHKHLCSLEGASLSEKIRLGLLSRLHDEQRKVAALEKRIKELEDGNAQKRVEDV